MPFQPCKLNAQLINGGRAMLPIPEPQPARPVARPLFFSKYWLTITTDGKYIAPSPSPPMTP